MFPEYRDLISRLKYTLSDYSFNLGKNASGIVFNQTAPPEEGADGRGYNAEVVRMKKQKLQLKDEMLKILQQESVKEV
ncbi:DUF465 domain-containing protein [Escherichia coli]|uniref:DUF465 domain-containing protein n=1 Tax=Escherichia coli TaxID=562 RepID=UPI0007511621|nr:DUF465 domain-containing protein [Escherichia coli]KUT64626.1 hypothetical protein AWF03_17585 [Escherichia coli]